MAAENLGDIGRPLTFRARSKLAVVLLATFGLADLVERDENARPTPH